MFILFIYLFIYLSIYLLLHWVFVAVRGLSLVVVSGASLPHGVWVSHCGDFSHTHGSRHTDFSSGGMQAQ